MVNLFFWKRRRPSPPKVPTDTVIPLHSFDDRPINRSIQLLFMMRFDDVLDPEKLRSSLEKLLEREGWRKLGARLRRNEDWKLDYHIPAHYDRSTRPAVAFSHVRYEVAIGEHPLASRLPRAGDGLPSSRPAVACDPDAFASLMRRADGPASLADYLFGDEPQLGLHVVSFADATLVSLGWPHTLFDGMGRRELLRAWAAVLEGRDGDVLPFYGYDRDPLADLGRDPGPDPEPFKMAEHLMSKWQMAVYGVRYVWDLIWNREEEARVLTFCPAQVVKTLFEETRAEFDASRAAAAAAAENSDGKTTAAAATVAGPTFLSEGDILCAYVARLATLGRPGTSTQTLSVMNALGLRGALLPAAGAAYVANAVWGVFARVTVGEAASSSRPLHAVAAAVRRSIAEYGTRAQLEARAAFLRARGADPAGMLDMYGDAGMMMLTFSNWSKARFFETDFSAAIVDNDTKTSSGGSGGGSSSKPANYHRGRPSYIQSCGFVQNFSMRNAFPIIGKDNAGNYWWSGTLVKGQWAPIEKMFETNPSGKVI
ncbi:hypothetical protein F4809DRAFT_656142 [Biscogniauxia mediterranea]|nr:hypothetical protein F4809DRAFT_656142 [Biscogniauxia mediterranea]